MHSFIHDTLCIEWFSVPFNQVFICGFQCRFSCKYLHIFVALLFIVVGLHSQLQNNIEPKKGMIETIFQCDFRSRAHPTNSNSVCSKIMRSIYKKQNNIFALCTFEHVQASRGLIKNDYYIFNFHSLCS